MLTNFPAGISSMGIPIPAMVYAPYMPVPNCRTWFVRSTTGRNVNVGNWGRDPSQPLASITYAISQISIQSRANQGDMIFVLPGHVETITGAGGITANVAGVWILGMGIGRDRPQINFTTAVGASFLVSAANVRLQNVRLTMTGFDAITAGLSITAADFALLDCEIEHASASAQATLALLTDANANRLQIQRCRFWGTGDAGTTAAVRLVGGDDITIIDSVFEGAYGAGNGAIENITTPCTNLKLLNNLIDNRTAASTKAIVLHASTTGRASNNRMQILSGTAPITGAAFSWVGGNYYAAAIATAGTLI